MKRRGARFGTGHRQGTIRRPSRLPDSNASRRGAHPDMDRDTALWSEDPEAVRRTAQVSAIRAQAVPVRAVRVTAS